MDDLGPATPSLFDDLGPVYVQRLVGGHMLVSIRGESRVVEVTSDGQVAWEMGGFGYPAKAYRL